MDVHQHNALAILTRAAEDLEKVVNQAANGRHPLELSAEIVTRLGEAAGVVRAVQRELMGTAR